MVIDQKYHTMIKILSKDIYWSAIMSTVLHRLLSEWGWGVRVLGSVGGGVRVRI
jgi:hypothetical protein